MTWKNQRWPWKEKRELKVKREIFHMVEKFNEEGPGMAEDWMAFQKDRSKL